MSWFDSGLASLAKTALSTAQKTIDKALDIQHLPPNNPAIDGDEFFESYGLSNKEITTTTTAPTTATKPPPPTKDPSTKGVKWATKEISGFWNEWFTEPNASKLEDDSSPKEKATTVMSQPQRSKLFPPESSTSAEGQEPPEEPIQQQPLATAATTTTPPPLQQPSPSKAPDTERKEEEEEEEDRISENDSTLSYNAEEDIPQDGGETIVYRESDPISQSPESTVIAEEELAEVKDFEIKSFDSAASLCTSSSSSFIKCCAEDVESNREPSPNSAPMSERSSDKPDSHASSEETSSDIEIISAGEARQCSPLKQALKKCQRSESPGSEGSMPVLQEQDENLLMNISDQDRETPEYQETFDSQEHLLRNLAELQDVVEMREKKVLELSKENSQLQDQKLSLENKLKTLETSYSNETKEFTKRLAQMEHAFHILTQDRNKIKSQLDSIQKETSSKPSIKELQATLEEKETQISELMREGEALSKQQLQYSTVIKKLRTKEKESESTIKTLKEKLEESDKELERLRKSLEAKDEQEEKHIEIVGKLTHSLTKKEKEMAQLHNEMEDMNEKYSRAKSSLDDAYNQLTHYHQLSAEQENKAQEAALSVELAAQSRMRQALEQAQAEQQALTARMWEAQEEVVRVEAEASRREALLHADISLLQQRLQEMEKQVQDLTLQMGAANLPLLQQIEHLQRSLQSSRSQWEAAEQELVVRLEETNRKMEAGKLREKELGLEVDSLRSQLEAAQSLVASLTAQLQTAQLDLAMAEEAISREKKNAEQFRANYSEQLSTLQQAKEAAEAALLEQQQQQQQQHSPQPLQRSVQPQVQEWWESPSTVPSEDRCHSPSRFSSVSEWHEEGDGRMSLYDSVRHTSVLEGLHTQLKLKEGELFQLQAELRRAEKLKEALGNEVTALTRQNQQLQTELNTLRDIQPLHKDLEERYNALLQMFGEKVEQVEELQLDLQDVKAMYRNQIDELMGKK